MRAAAGTDPPSPAPFPWDGVLHAGFCLLRLSGRDFWAMTPREMRAALGGLRPREAGPDRAGLEALMAAFPDGDAQGRMDDG